jgi:prolipoprotein diacylglyceryltransferase
VYPQLIHFGRFFLPTYGFLVSLGVLLGLWISVRNSERIGINGENAWNFGRITQRIPARFSVSPRCRPVEFFPEA